MEDEDRHAIAERRLQLAMDRLNHGVGREEYEDSAATAILAYGALDELRRKPRDQVAKRLRNLSIMPLKLLDRRGMIVPGLCDRLSCFVPDRAVAISDRRFS